MSEWYHCGVCNDIINAQKKEDHFKSENHENNLASAYHKCLYYNDLDKLNESEVASDPIAPSFTYSPTDYAENVCCGTSESGIVDLSVSDVFGNVESNPKEPNYRISYATVAATASKKYSKFLKNIFIHIEHIASERYMNLSLRAVQGRVQTSDTRVSSCMKLTFSVVNDTTCHLHIVVPLFNCVPCNK